MRDERERNKEKRSVTVVDELASIQSRKHVSDITLVVRLIFVLRNMRKLAGIT